MKKAIGILLAMAVILTLGACGPSANEAASQKAEEKGSSAKSAEPEGDEKKEKLRVCIVYTGNLGDKSYNDSPPIPAR